MKPLVYKKSRRVRGTEPKRHKMHIAKGDTVRVISGEHRGKEGRVLHVYPKKYRVVVEGVNVVKKHKRATTPQGESGIIEFPASVAASKVMLLDPKSGEPTRVRRRLDKEGKLKRRRKNNRSPSRRSSRRSQSPRKRRPRRRLRPLPPSPSSRRRRLG